MKFLFLIFFLASCAVNKKIVIAHRGASAYLPEHTLEAVSLAHAFNVDYIEPDIVLTRDNVPIILHDIILDEVTDVAKKFPKKKRSDGHYYAIDLSLKQIKKLQVTERVRNGKAKYPLRFPPKAGNFTIPTLKEYVSVIEGLNKSRKKNIGLYPEIKKPVFHNKNKKDISKIVLKFLEREISSSTPVILQCFDFKEVKRIRTELGFKGTLVQLIADNSWGESPTDYNYLMTDEGLLEVRKYADGLGMWITHLLPTKGRSVLKKAKSLGFQVHGYTFRSDSLPKNYNSDKEMLDVIFKDLKLDGLFSDHPDLVLKYLDR